MDKELLRWVIVLFGGLVMVVMILWHFIKTLRNRSDSSDLEEDEFEDDDEVELFDIEEDEDEFSALPPDLIDESLASVPKIPALIEFSLVARADEGFNGLDLLDAFERAGLKYGSVKVFERIDENRLVDFAVASMLEPGTFPDEDLEDYFCPGIVFFMQPKELDDPVAVFEDFIDTIDQLADELDGVVWDNQRQPLSDETVEKFRQCLSV
ncbi:MAG: cell division protein FtsZ [Methylococcaceae bacterium]|jgi:cell division protein ZipA|nr:cell division protein FtsZ [Methylococcaceae bacterium]